MRLWLLSVACLAAGYSLAVLRPTEDPWPLMLSIYKQVDATTPHGSVVFLGDSIIQSLSATAVSPQAVNFGISGQTSGQLLSTLGQYTSLKSACAVVLMIGVNDIRHGVDGLGERYKQLLLSIPAPVVLASVTPVAGFDISTAVTSAKSACKSHSRCTFVDVSNLPPGSMKEDGIHLTTSGYAHLIPLLRDAITTAGKEHPPEPAHSRRCDQQRSGVARRPRTSWRPGLCRHGWWTPPKPDRCSGMRRSSQS